MKNDENGRDDDTVTICQYRWSDKTLKSDGFYMKTI